VEVGFGFDGVAIEPATAFGNGGIEIGEGLEVSVDERLVDEGPEAFGGLKLGTVRRQIDELDAVGNGESDQAVPAGIVEHQDDGAIAARAGGSGEGREQGFEEGLGDAVGDIPNRLARARGDEGGHIEPFVAVVADGDRTLTDRRPDPAADRLQAEPVLVRRPDLDRAFGVFRGGLSDGGAEFFLNASRSSGVAARG